MIRPDRHYPRKLQTYGDFTLPRHFVSQEAEK
jgi:hypothetical protein